MAGSPVPVSAPAGLRAPPGARAEIELQLALASKDAARVLDHPALGAATSATLEPVALLSIYYDTPAFDLWQRGVALRLRRTSAGWVQTIKWGGTSLGGLHARGELERPVAGQQVDLSQLRAPELSGPLADIGRLRGLKPVFVTEFQRTSRRLRIEPDTTIELSIDRGAIVAGAASESICELELELESGAPAALFVLARSLGEDIALRPLARSKAERGYALAGQSGGPVKAPPIELAPGATLGQAIEAVLASGLRQLQSNEAGMLQAADPEYLHQQRVAVRRLRCALAIFSPALPAGQAGALSQELRWLGTKLGHARDLDVFVTEMLPPLVARLAQHRQLAQLGQAAQEQRTRALAAARAVVRSRRYGRLVMALGEVVAAAAVPHPDPQSESGSPAKSFAATILEQRHRKCLTLGKRIDEATPDRLHALRISLKKLRYAGEFFGALYAGARARTLRAHLAKLQDSLGRINDAATMQSLADGGIAGDAVTRALIAGWCAGRVHGELEQLRPLWRELRRARRYW